MTNIQRVKKVLQALLMILCSVIMVIDPEDGFYIVAVIVSFSLILYGVRTLFYFFTMARHMVGGKSNLYIGIVVLDLGVFILTTVDDPKFFIVIYILVVHAFSGVISMLHAFEEKRFGSPGWKWSFTDGFINLAFAVAAIIFGLFLNSATDLSYLYAGCLFYSACTLLSTAFRKTAIVFVQ